MPAGQVAQEAAPAPLNWPAAHELHPLAPALADPVPAGQLAQAVLAEASENMPTAQSEQDEAPKPEYWPARQAPVTAPRPAVAQ